MQFFANVDVNTFLLLNSFAGHLPLTDFFIIFFALYLAFILPVVFLILLYRATSPVKEKLWIVGIVFFSAFFARFGITSLIRFFYHRPRPFLVYHLQPLFENASYSFPSGHAAFFFAFAFAIYLYNKKWGVWFFAFALFMSIARIMAGVHYPSDILGGIVVGVVIAYLSSKYLRGFNLVIK